MSAVQLKSLLQDRRWVARNQDLKWGNHSDVSESEYDVVDDQEDMLDVRILPARPMYDETEYAGRQIPIFTHYLNDIFHRTCLNFILWLWKLFDFVFGFGSVIRFVKLLIFIVDYCLWHDCISDTMIWKPFIHFTLSSPALCNRAPLTSC